MTSTKHQSKESWVLIMAGAVLATASSAVAQEATEDKPREVLRRHDTSSFAFASTLQVKANHRQSTACGWVMNTPTFAIERARRTRTGGLGAGQEEGMLAFNGVIKRSANSS